MSEFLDAFAAYVRANDLPVFRIAEAVGEGEPEAVTIRPCGASLNGYSVAKAFVVTAIGLLADEGKLRVEERVMDILGERPGMDPRWRDVTVDMALTHRIGLPQNCLDIDCQDVRLFGRDYLSYVFSVPLEQNPGEERVYTDAAYYLLACIAEEKAGMPADVYLWDRLLYDLGFAELAWSRCPMGHVMGATGLYVRAQDAVKIGQLYMHGGTYRGKRYLSKAWVDAVLEQEYEFHAYCGGYAKGGMLGQMLAFFPAQERAVAWHSSGEDLGGPMKTFIAAWQADHP
ncbi:MAG: serine hydrolase [Clostridia bacterium]|nr:serine hydrolase [Clostridia bacterium]